MENNLTYFLRRASQEKAIALRATHPRARQAHLDMVQEYEHLIRRLAADERSSKRKFEPYSPPRAFAEPEAADAETRTAEFAR